MLRSFLFCATIFWGFSTSTIAAEVKGTIKKLDAEGMTLTLTVAGKDVSYSFSKETKFVNETGQDLPSGFKAMRFKPGKEVTLTTEKKEGKEVAVRVQGPRPK